MTQYHICLIFAVVCGLQTCNSASTLKREEVSTLPSLRREVEDNSRYKTREANETMLKLLVSDKNGVSRTEVFDMLHSRDDNLDHVDLPPFPEDEEDARADVPLPPEPKQQAELLQGPEEAVYRDGRWRVETEAEVEEEAGAEVEGRGAAAAVMLLVVCAVVITAYGALIVWRRIYLQRNGLKHEQLKNEPNIEETIDM